MDTNVTNDNAGRFFLGKTVLIANNHFTGFTGSEIHSVQLAQYFIDQGAKVHVFGLMVDEPMISNLKRLGIERIRLSKILNPFRNSYDLIWTHHETIFLLLHVLVGLKSRLNIHGILSTSIPLERTPLPAALSHDRNITFLANSEETKAFEQQSSGVSDIEVLLNFVPEGFYKTTKTAYSHKLKTIAVVSNHVPPELLDAKELLEAKGIQVTIFGIDHQYETIDHNTLIGFDLVVSIGKTAQYCLVQKIPLFLYDHFGGPGYFTNSEKAHHENYNFSGRSEPTIMSSSKIAEQIVSGYSAALKNTAAFSKSDAERYSIKGQLTRILAKETPQFQPTLTKIARVKVFAHYLFKRTRTLMRVIAPRFAANIADARENKRKSAVQ